MATSASSSPEPCPFCHGAGYLRRDVPPGHAEFGTPVLCVCRQREAERRRLETLVARSKLDQPALRRMTFDQFSPDGFDPRDEIRGNVRRAYQFAQEYAEHPQGWFVLTGGNGCGKTHLAVAIANACVARGVPVLFIVVPDLLDDLRAAYAPNSEVSYDETFEEVRSAPLLILDDLGTQSNTAWADEKLFQIINHRYNAALPTVITTNRSMDELPVRIASRITDPACSRVYRVLARDSRDGLAERAGQSPPLSLVPPPRRSARFSGSSRPNNDQG